MKRKGILATLIMAIIALFIAFRTETATFGAPNFEIKPTPQVVYNPNPLEIKDAANMPVASELPTNPTPETPKPTTPAPKATEKPVVAAAPQDKQFNPLTDTSPDVVLGKIDPNFGLMN